MNDKVNILLVVPEIGESYNLFLPINKKIGTIIQLLNKAINELTNGAFPIMESCRLYNADTMQKYDMNVILYNTDIRNSTRLILLSKGI